MGGWEDRIAEEGGRGGAWRLSKGDPVLSKKGYKEGHSAKPVNLDRRVIRG